jgi:hypothetical protein
MVLGNLPHLVVTDTTMSGSRIERGRGPTRLTTSIKGCQISHACHYMRTPKPEKQWIFLENVYI